MSRSEHGDEPLDGQPQYDTTLAFEYVAGSLSIDEKRKFRLRLNSDHQLQEEVQFWEQQLMNILPAEQRSPQANTWQNINKAINPQSPSVEHSSTPKLDWKILWQWSSSVVAAVALMFLLIGYYPKDTAPHIATAPTIADYVAVLTDAEGRAQLTAISAANEKSMQLKWEARHLTPDTTMQLWAISKRDGEVRPIAIFTDTSIKSLPLNNAQWRLVTDADYLLLTEEEMGGSAIDEPSDNLLAKGVCVRFSPDKPAT